MFLSKYFCAERHRCKVFRNTFLRSATPRLNNIASWRYLYFLFLHKIIPSMKRSKYFLRLCGGRQLLTHKRFMMTQFDGITILQEFARVALSLYGKFNRTDANPHVLRVNDEYRKRLSCNAAFEGVFRATFERSD